MCSPPVCLIAPKLHTCLGAWVWRWAWTARHRLNVTPRTMLSWRPLPTACRFGATTNPPGTLKSTGIWTWLVGYHNSQSRRRLTSKYWQVWPRSRQTRLSLPRIWTEQCWSLMMITKGSYNAQAVFEKMEDSHSTYGYVSTCCSWDWTVWTLPIIELSYLSVDLPCRSPSPSYDSFLSQEHWSQSSTLGPLTHLCSALATRRQSLAFSTSLLEAKHSSSFIW